MDDRRVGLIVRALRRRRGWRQSDLAAASDVSQQTVSVVERGHLDTLSLRTSRRILSALDARGEFEVRWRGGSLDRTMDENHARLVGAVVESLRAHDWDTAVEVTYAVYGERGSIDVLGFHRRTGSLLVIEVKTEITSVEETLRKLDEKVRLADRIARARLRMGCHDHVADPRPAGDLGSPTRSRTPRAGFRPGHARPNRRHSAMAQRTCWFDQRAMVPGEYQSPWYSVGTAGSGTCPRAEFNPKSWRITHDAWGVATERRPCAVESGPDFRPSTTGASKRRKAGLAGGRHATQAARRHARRPRAGPQPAVSTPRACGCRRRSWPGRP